MTLIIETQVLLALSAVAMVIGGIVFTAVYFIAIMFFDLTDFSTKLDVDW